MQPSEYHLMNCIIQVLLSLFTLCILKCYVSLLFQTDKASKMAFLFIISTAKLGSTYQTHILQVELQPHFGHSVF